MSQLVRFPLFVVACLISAALPRLGAADEISSGKPVTFVLGVDDKLPTTTDGWYGKAFTFKVEKQGSFKVTARPRGTGRAVFIELLSPAKKRLGSVEGKELRISELPANGEYQLNISSMDVGDITFTASFDGQPIGDAANPGEGKVADKDNVLRMIEALSDDVAQMEDKLSKMREQLNELRRALGGETPEQN